MCKVHSHYLSPFLSLSLSFSLSHSPSLSFSFLFLSPFRAKLHHNASLVQVPIGLESSLEGVVDLVNERALYYTGDLG